MVLKSRWYILLVMTVIYVFNFIDRQLITVLAPYIKDDLHISDAQIALLYGTAFALFYGLLGIPLAKLADNWNRAKTLSLGVAFWSIMTMLSGVTANFVQLGLARIGVGVGEASASPAAVSLLSHHFQKNQRATAFALYATGIFIGSGVSLILGGGIVSLWTHAYGSGASAPLGLTGWEAAFLIVGAPGLALAALIHFTIKEPRVETGAISGGVGTALRIIGVEAGTMFPPWSLLFLYRNGRRRDFLLNLAFLFLCIAGAIGLIAWTDTMLLPTKRGVIAAIGTVEITSNSVQWIALAVAIYGTLSWTQSLLIREPEGFRVIIRSKPLMAMSIGGGFIGVAMYSANSFNFIYAVRYLAFGPEAGLKLGVLAAIAGVFGSISGGMFGDILKARNPGGRVYLLMFNYAIFGVATYLQYTTSSVYFFHVWFGLATFFLTTWSGLAFAIGQDVLPVNYRGSGFAIQALATNIIGLGLGPYCVGLMSDATGDLRSSLLTVILATYPVVAVCLLVCARSTATQEAMLADVSEPVRPAADDRSPVSPNVVATLSQR